MLCWYLGEKTKKWIKSKIRVIRKIGKSNYKIVKSHMPKKSFSCYQNSAKNKVKLKVQLFLVCVLVPLALASQPFFYLVFKVSNLIHNMAIGEMKLINTKVIISFSKYSLWKVVTSLQRYWKANVSS